MNTSERQRKLSTILAMDVVNYTAKMGMDEEGTLEQLAICRGILEEEVAKQQGRIFNTAGDAFMVEFASPVGAVSAAINIQNSISQINTTLSETQKLEFRMGINMGDIIIEGDNLFGDGVNVAARLEGIAPPGGICISETIQLVVDGKIDIEFVDQGLQTLKNVEKPVKAFYLELDPGSGKARTFKPDTKGSQSSRRWLGISIIALLGIIILQTLLNRDYDSSSTQKTANSIAVLPLETSLKDQEIQDLGIGLTQDLSQGLIKAAKQLNIVTLNKAPEDLTTIFNELGAGYFISGKLRKGGDSIRVSVNLIDAKTTGIVWSENYDRKFTAANVFALQDEIVNNIVEELVGNGAVLAKEVAKNVYNAGTENLDAYECVNFVRGQFFKVLSTDLHERSVACLKQAVADDPGYKEAWQLLAQMLSWGYGLFGTMPKSVLYEAEKAVDNAIRIDKNFARAYASKAEISLMLHKRDEVYEYGEKAVALAPNDAGTVGIISYVIGALGFGCSSPENLVIKYGYDRELSCQRLERGYELAKIANQLDVGNINSYDNYGLGNYYLEKRMWKEVLAEYEKIPNPDFVWWNLCMGIAYHGLGDLERAKQMFSKIHSLAGPKSLARVENDFAIYGLDIYTEEMRDMYIEMGLQ